MYLNATGADHVRSYIYNNNQVVTVLQNMSHKLRRKIELSFTLRCMCQMELGHLEALTRKLMTSMKVGTFFSREQGGSTLTGNHSVAMRK